MQRLRGLKKLIHDAIDETTKLVQVTHQSVSRKRTRHIGLVPSAKSAARAAEQIEQFIAGGVYGIIRAVNRVVDIATDLPITIAAEAASKLNMPQTRTDMMQGVLNGIIGDYLHCHRNQLAVETTLRANGSILPAETNALKDVLPKATRKVVVFVHGLCGTERSWNLYAEQYYGDPDTNFGTQLERDLGYTPLFVRYNTGRHISDNGQELSELLAKLFESFPVPIEEIVLVGHSMGGLVVRSAAHYGDHHGDQWVEALAHVFCIASPHLGAPLEKATNLLGTVLSYFDTPGTSIPAAILKARSAGIKDMRFGYVVEEEWVDCNPDALLEDNRQDIPFLDHVGYYFLVSTFTRDPKHPTAGLLGDLLVHLPSAAGHHPKPARRIPFHFGRVFPGMHHLHVLNHPDVYEQIRALCEAGLPRRIAGLLKERAGVQP
jgi:pimeloyl-ACP methyl ester carboxylesterase